MTLTNDDVRAVQRAVQNRDEAEFRRICETKRQNMATEWACVATVALVLVLSVFAAGYAVGVTVARRASADCYTYGPAGLLR